MLAGEFALVLRGEFRIVPPALILVVCTDILTVPATCHNLAGLINYEARKPVRIRRGRATVIDLSLVGMRFESQTFLRSI